MDNIKEKIARVTDLSTYTDITPENLKKVFADIGSSPEKLRTVLNLWFVPDFKPTFVEPPKDTLDGLQDIDFLDVPDTEGVQRPLRLIDLETGNLVDSWNTSPLDSYCMLSHRWKGDEITLGHIKRAREKHLERARLGLSISNEKSARFAVEDDDTHLVLEQCKEDILEQEQTILALSRHLSAEPKVEELLERRLKAKEARGKTSWAQQNLDAKKAKTERSRIEQEMFDQIIQRVNHELTETVEEIEEAKGSVQNSLVRLPPTSAFKSAPHTSPLVAEADEEYANAQKLLNLALDNQNATLSDVDFFRDNSRLGYAVDEMLSRLQRWKSAIKLINAISEARKIFARRNFPSRGARYIWSDTCCIDKSNYGELSQSLSLMGDWYANADFCLVHLDTNWRAVDAVQDWRVFKGRTDEQMTANFENFDAISQSIPEWSNRAWTLQELVMSKMSFFVNSEWQPLCRPVESLGYLYPLLPFVELYTRGGNCSIFGNRLKTQEAQCAAYLMRIKESKAIGSYIETGSVEIAHGDQAVSERIRHAVRLIMILQGINFKFPTDMTTETAIPEMTRAVYLAAWKLVRGDKDDLDRVDRDILQKLKDERPLSWTESANLGSEQQAQEIINFLLTCLVSETISLVVTDREYIARFGQVSHLDSWKRGTARRAFPAQQVLQLSSQRIATVPVDHVYSLMGVLGVRCPTFHAEGYPRALARLLDEVIISQNDVSVFNWTGVEMGSPVRGRSLYPASHKAYGTEDDRGRRYNMLIAAETHKKRIEIAGTYHGIIKMLQETIECVKTKGRSGIPIEWVREICAFIRKSSFDQLRPELDSLGRILLYVKDYCGEPPISSPIQGSSSPTETSPPSAAPEEKTTWGFNVKPSLPGVKISSSMKSPKVPSFAISKPAFGRHHSEPKEKAELDKLESESCVAPPASKQPVWMNLDVEVRQYLKSLASSGQIQRLPLPERIARLDFKVTEPGTIVPHSEEDMNDDLGGLTCPNPIIVNNSGIDGIFDIQRIVVTMLDRNKLLRQVSKASSAKQQISGWCTISTGFASVAINFACEQHILKKQLDIEMTVEDKIIKSERAKKLHSDFEIQKSAKNNEQSSNPADGYEKDKDGAEVSKGSPSFKPTKEEQEVVRIIEFIQEPKLQLVAGEWVLCRFSGVPRAKWFLCYLELGSTHQFYGRRIATSDIDFANSAVESGLVNAWQTYMARKKRKMCGILDMYIKSFESAARGEEKLRMTSEMANQGRERLINMGSQSLERVASMGSGLYPSIPKMPVAEADEDAKNRPFSDSDDSDDENFNDLLDHGKKVAMALGEYTVLAAYERISERYARHLDKYLATSVLKKTPKSLQAAVESVNENRNFLPAMFHSSRRVHMF